MARNKVPNNKKIMRSVRNKGKGKYARQRMRTEANKRRRAQDA